MTARTFKYSGKRSECTMLLVQAFYGLKYKVIHSTCATLLDMAPKWKHERDYQFRERINGQLQHECREKHNLRPPNLIDVTEKRIWIALPYNTVGKTFGIQVTWRGHNDFTIFCSTEDEETWVVHYTRLLFKIAYDLKRIVNPVQINGQELKVGEWLAALLFQLSGDKAGMLATLDEAEDRK